jgi:hypothetical protein
MKRFVILLLVFAAVSLPGAVTRSERFDGRPEFKEGKALGYFVWRDGDTWKLRWTTFGAEHRFSGRVSVEGGVFTSFKRVDADVERKVIAPGRPARVVRGPRGRVRAVTPGKGAVVATRDEDRLEQETERLIRFTTRTDDDIDGLDFKVGPAADRLTFVLEIEGKPVPGEVEVGRTNFQPKEHPLIVTLR